MTAPYLFASHLIMEKNRNDFFLKKRIDLNSFLTVNVKKHKLPDACKKDPIKTNEMCCYLYLTTLKH